jgi:hypothetical protein
VIVHVILFEPRADLTASERASVIAALADAARKAPTVRGCRIGRRVTHGLPGYEHAMARNYEFVAILEFDSVDGLREYLRHPAHEAAGAFFTSAAADALAYDFHLVELEDASLNTDL